MMMLPQWSHANRNPETAGGRGNDDNESSLDSARCRPGPAAKLLKKDTQRPQSNQADTVRRFGVGAKSRNSRQALDGCPKISLFRVLLQPTVNQADLPKICATNALEPNNSNEVPTKRTRLAI